MKYLMSTKGYDAKCDIRHDLCTFNTKDRTILHTENEKKYLTELENGHY
jgi:hypothetical protein